jgi:hypothetical protein
MGIDGQNTLTLRGPKHVLDELEANGCGIENDISPYLLELYFGRKNVEILARKPNYLVIRYAFRNMVFHDYLQQLLYTYPQIWMKNEYVTELGEAGVWIGRMFNQEPQIQQASWQELTPEEQFYQTDFSVSLADSQP